MQPVCACEVIFQKEEFAIRSLKATMFVQEGTVKQSSRKLFARTHVYINNCASAPAHINSRTVEAWMTTRNNPTSASDLGLRPLCAGCIAIHPTAPANACETYPDNSGMQHLARIHADTGGSSMAPTSPPPPLIQTPPSRPKRNPRPESRACQNRAEE